MISVAAPLRLRAVHAPNPALRFAPLQFKSLALSDERKETIVNLPTPRPPRHRPLRPLIVAVCAALMAACGGAPSASQPTAASQPAAETTRPAAPTVAPTAKTAKVKIVDAVFATKLGDQMEPIDEVKDTSYTPDQSVMLSVKLEGRPKKGVVEATFFWGKEKIQSVKLDLADANGGVIVSIGENTFLGFTLKPTSQWPISGKYHVDLTLDGAPLQSYTYKVVPPADASATRVTKATLARGVDDKYQPIDETTTFAQDEKAFLVVSGDFGKASWMRADWYIAGKLDEKGTTTLGPVTKNSTDAGLSFSYLPEGGWPAGDHEVALIVNDVEIERYKFTIGDAAAQADATAAPTDSAATDATPADAATSGAMVVGDLKTYTHPSKVFSIDVPSNWKESDSSTAGTLSVSWVDPSGVAGVLTNVTTVEQTLTAAELTEKGTEFVKTVFGAEADFVMGDTKVQSDKSILVPFTATHKIDGTQVEIGGLTYIEQRGTHLSVLTVLYPLAQEDAFFKGPLDKIINSYTLDTDATIP